MFAAIVSCKKEKEVDLIQAYKDSSGLVFEETESGLLYHIERQGSGDFPSMDEEVEIIFVGQYTDGVVFDSSFGLKETKSLSSQVAGFREGVTLLKRGGKAVFIIPSELGYGTRGNGVISGNTPLVYTIDLVDF